MCYINRSHIFSHVKLLLLLNFYITLPLCLFPQEAINLIEPMTNDPVNYVRQGALIASAMILVQQNEVTCPKVSTKITT